MIDKYCVYSYYYYYNKKLNIIYIKNTVILLIVIPYINQNYSIKIVDLDKQKIFSLEISVLSLDMYLPNRMQQIIRKVRFLIIQY